MIELNSDILIIIVGIILGLLLLKLLTKFIFKAIGLLVLIGGGLFYTYFYTDFFEKHQDNAIVQAIEDKIDFVSIFEYKEKHCGDKMKTRKDSITCECIVEPIMEDLKDHFNDRELNELMTDKKKYINEIYAAVRRNKDDIIENIKERKAIDIWNKMVRNLRNGKFLEDE